MSAEMWKEIAGCSIKGTFRKQGYLGDTINAKMKNSLGEKVREICQQIEWKDKEIGNMSEKHMKIRKSSQEVPQLNFKNLGKRMGKAKWGKSLTKKILGNCYRNPEHVQTTECSEKINLGTKEWTPLPKGFQKQKKEVSHRGLRIRMLLDLMAALKVRRQNCKEK